MKKDKNFEVTTFLEDILQPQKNIFKRVGHNPSDLFDYIYDTLNKAMDRLKREIKGNNLDSLDHGRAFLISDIYVDFATDACLIAIKNYSGDSDIRMYELPVSKITSFKHKLTDVLLDKFETEMLSRMFVAHLTLAHANSMITAIKNRTINNQTQS